MKNDGHFHLTDAQTKALRNAVHGKVVADLGCGHGRLSATMTDLGATTVHAVDKEDFRVRHPHVVWHRSYFQHWDHPKDIEVAVLSWPINNSLVGLVTLLHRFPYVVYLGKNTEGSACGNPDLFRYLSGRESLLCVTDRRNTLVHYGPNPRKDQTLHHEEWSAFYQDGGMSPFNPDNSLRTHTDWLSQVTSKVASP